LVAEEGLEPPTRGL